MSKMKRHTKQATRPSAKQSPFEHGKPWPGPRPVQPREQGHAMGAGFAALNGAQAQRREHMADAIHAGFREAAARDEMTSELSQDSEHLEQMGFGKPTR
jgi:hypothetical protein